MEAHGGRVQSQQLKCKRPAGLFWEEKLWLLVDWLQLFGLYWQATNPWPWPYLWLHYTRWTVALNLDYFSLSPTGALNGSTTTVDLSKWGEMPYYLLYGTFFGLPMFLLIVGYLGYLNPYYFNQYGVNRTDSKHVFLKYALTAGHLLYLPICLAVFRLYYCDPKTNTLGADSNITCNSNGHVLAVVLGTVFMLPLAIGLPVVTYNYIHQSAVYNIPEDHEKRLQIWEVMYMLKIDNVFLEKQLWLTSSFRRPYAYFRFEMLLLKMAALIVFIFVRHDFNVQGGLFWFLYGQFSVRYLFAFPYRNLSTNAMLKVLCALLLSDITFGLMNATSTKSAMLVGSVETLWLLTINGSGSLLLLAVIVLSVINPFAVAPADTTISGINNNSSNAMVKAYTRWVCCLRNYHLFRKNWYTGTRLNADVIGMDQLIRQLRRQWLIARSKGSLFETPLTEALEDLLIMRSFAPKGDRFGDRVGEADRGNGASLRRRECWNRAMEETSADGMDSPHTRLLAGIGHGGGWSGRTNLGQSLFSSSKNKFLSPQPYNASNPRIFAQTVKRRSDNYVLMNPKKKRILQKLLALRALIGNRNLAHFDRQGLSAEEAEHNWVLNEAVMAKRHEEAVLAAHNRIPELITESNAALLLTKELIKKQEQLEVKLAAEGGNSRVDNYGNIPNSEIQTQVPSDLSVLKNAQLADLEQCQLKLLDLVAEWNDTIETYEARNVNAVGTKAAIAAKSLAARADKILAKYDKAAYTAEEQEEWYTYRMVLNDKLELLYEATATLGGGSSSEDATGEREGGGEGGDSDEDSENGSQQGERHGGQGQGQGQEQYGYSLAGDDYNDYNDDDDDVGLFALGKVMSENAGTSASDIALPSSKGILESYKLVVGSPSSFHPHVSKLDISSLLRKDDHRYTSALIDNEIDADADLDAQLDSEMQGLGDVVVGGNIDVVVGGTNTGAGGGVESGDIEANWVMEEDEEAPANGVVPSLSVSALAAAPRDAEDTPPADGEGNVANWGDDGDDDNDIEARGAGKRAESAVGDENL